MKDAQDGIFFSANRLMPLELIWPASNPSNIIKSFSELKVIFCSTIVDATDTPVNCHPFFKGLFFFASHLICPSGTICYFSLSFPQFAFFF